MNNHFIILLILLSLYPNSAYAMRATTIPNSIACHSENHINDIIQFTSSKDRESFQAYIDNGYCIILNGGLDVTVIESPGLFGGKTCFVYKGIKMWTTRGGLTDYRVDDSEKKPVLKENKGGKTEINRQKEAAEWKKVEEILNRKANKK